MMANLSIYWNFSIKRNKTKLIYVRFWDQRFFFFEKQIIVKWFQIFPNFFDDIDWTVLHIHGTLLHINFINFNQVYECFLQFSKMLLHDWVDLFFKKNNKNEWSTLNHFFQHSSESRIGLDQGTRVLTLISVGQACFLHFLQAGDLLRSW